MVDLCTTSEPLRQMVHVDTQFGYSHPCIKPLGNYSKVVGAPLGRYCALGLQPLLFYFVDWY